MLGTTLWERARAHEHLSTLADPRFIQTSTDQGRVMIVAIGD